MTKYIKVLQENLVKLQLLQECYFKKDLFTFCLARSGSLLFFSFGDMNNAFSKSFEGTPLFFMKKSSRHLESVRQLT
jgi:hypothetical protein